MSPAQGRCPRAEKLDEAFWSKDAAIAAHCSVCASCAQQWQSIADLAASAASIKPPALTPAQSEELRTAVLAGLAPPRAVQSAPRIYRRWPTYAAATAVAGVILLGWRAWPTSSRDVTPMAAVQIMPHDDARFFESDPSGTSLRLEHGTLTLDVPTVTPARSFAVVLESELVRTADAKFDVRSVNGQLVSLRVLRGRVAVQGARLDLQWVSAGESWSRPAAPVAIEWEPLASQERPVVEAPPTPAPVPAPKTMARFKAREQTSKVRPRDVSPPSIATPPRESSAFAQGWRAMESKEFRKAANLFSEAARSESSAEAKDDATYWRAAALGRAGARSEAIEVFRWFVERYPASQRIGEVSSILGWLLVEDNQHSAAAEHFLRGSKDPSRRVRESAESGLETVQSHD